MSGTDWYRPPVCKGPDELADPVQNEHVRRKWLDLAYADMSPAQKLDLYLPDTGDGPFPVVVFIHGGAFAICDKADDQTNAYLLGLERGYAIASMNYRMSGEALFPAAVQDVKAAVRWLRAHAAQYHLDADRFVLAGQSAGGNLSTVAGLSAGVSLFEDPALGYTEYSSEVQAVVDQFGPTDFLKMDEQLTASGISPAEHSTPESPESLYLGAKIADVPDRVRQADPTTYIHSGMPPILIQHGTADADVPVQQSVEFAKAIEERVGADRFELDVFEGEEHSGPTFWTLENMDRVFTFLDEHLK